MEQKIFLQDYLVFIPAIKLKKNIGTTQIYSWKSNGISKESMDNITHQIAILHQFLLRIIYYKA